KFLEMLKEMNPPGSIAAAPAAGDSMASDTTMAMTPPPADSMMADSVMAMSSDTAMAAMHDAISADSTSMAMEMTPNVTPTDDTAEAAATDSGPLVFEAGQVITVPYVAEIKGKVNVIEPDGNNHLWIGTDYGIIRFDGSSWSMPGYVTTTVGENQNLDSLVAKSARLIPMSEESYRNSIALINNISDTALTNGVQLRTYRNPAASAVNYIAAGSRTVYFASDDGVIVFDGTRWGKLDQGGFDHDKAIAAEAIGDELWVAGTNRIVAKANGRTDISLMYVKWLPELASDLYYTFASLVTSKPGLGTFGGNITFISYGTIVRTNEQNVDLGSFDAFDVAFTGSYGGSLTNKLKGGISAKLLYSKLAEQGAGQEKGKGTSTGFALDFGLMYHWTPRLTLGMAVTNLGPDMAYIDAAQSDPLPRNLALGFAYKLLQNDYSHFLVTAEMNKSLVGINDGIKEELKQVVFNAGAEFMYANLIAVRGGYIYDQEGQIKTVTLGIGLAPLSSLKFDFSYIPSNTSSALANTLRISLSILP
ncbi:MAG TPA: PorV/PorQ family protein, partial [candidate division Zixibacteria bacterium]|nr:PorV/PorQ family protein [candidate division Zixibacteria bacterium]